MRLDARAEVDERVDERDLHAGPGGMIARHQHAHRRAPSAVHIGECVGRGAGLEQRAGHVDGVARRLLVVVLDAVGGHVVQERRPVHGWIEMSHARGAGINQRGIGLDER